MVNELKAAGICVVFVSHRLDEVMEVADRISVMRDGKLVGTYPASELDSHELAFLMTGQRFHYSPLPEKSFDDREPCWSCATSAAEANTRTLICRCMAARLSRLSACWAPGVPSFV